MKMKSYHESCHESLQTPEKPFEKTMTLIAQAVDSILEEEFYALESACLDTLAQGGKIIVSGLGKNVPICEKFVGTLHSCGISAAFMHTNSAVHGDLGMVKQEDLVIVLSKSGETIESIYLVDLLQKKKCSIWLLTFSGQSTLAEKVEDALVIDLAHEGDLWNVLPNHSTTLNLLVLQELAMTLIAKQEVPLAVLRENHPGGAIGCQLREEKP